MSDSLAWVFVFLLLTVLACLAGRAIARFQQDQGKAHGPAAESDILWPGGFSDAFQRSLDILAALEADLREADPGRGEIVARTGVYGPTFGLTIWLTMSTVEGETHVRVRAASSATPFDFGAARRFVRQFEEVWNRLPQPTGMY